MKSRGDATQKSFLPCKHPEETGIFHVAGEATLRFEGRRRLISGKQCLCRRPVLGKWDFAME